MPDVFMPDAFGGDAEVVDIGETAFDAQADAGTDASSMDATRMDASLMDASLADAHPADAATTCNATARAPAIGELQFNEILAAPPTGAAGDANGDGTRDSVADEFVEIANISSSVLDLSGVTVSDAVMVRHTFAANTTLACNKVIVVFGGGNPATDPNWKPNWVPSTTGDLSLNNNGDTVQIGTAAMPGSITSYTYESEGGNGQSLVRIPELTTAPFVLHSTAPNAGGRLFSPGTRVDGSPF
jgi:hypothetical protein